jgi:NAD(P)-dependent dehydrogenase (short-subunit alcohol dehydrogenase family)
MMEVRDKVPVVTAGAGGIGLALCTSYAHGGAHVVRSDLRTDRVHEPRGRGGQLGRRVRRARAAQSTITTQQVLARTSAIQVIANAPASAKKSNVIPQDRPTDGYGQQTTELAASVGPG